MTKKRSEIDIVPMVPALRRAGLAVEMLLVTCTACAGILAATVALVSSVW